MKHSYKKNYENEYTETIARLMDENQHLNHFKFFLDTAYSWINQEERMNQHPKIAVLGPGIPEEFIRAAGVEPYWILGGSLGACAWADDLLPRDTDPVHRSVMGFLHDPIGPEYSDTLFVIPANCDSMRKIAYILKEEGKKTVVMDIPPDKENSEASEKWKRQIYRLIEAVEEHTHRRITYKSLKKAAKEVNTARLLMRQFLYLSEGSDQIVSGAGRILVQNSYFYTNDLQQWCERMRAFIDEIKMLRINNKEIKKQPGILLMGSPVYFPNYKVGFLMNDIGLTIISQADVATLKMHVYTGKFFRCRTKNRLINEIADQWLKNDGSPSYVKNTAYYEYICELLRNHQIEGVVYHILKGQIEYDFELSVYEKLFSSLDIPVFRLETDYQYQDVEQLRIRMEAFSEMLKYRQRKKEEFVV